MPQVSRHPLKQEIAENISKEFIKVLLKLTYTKKDARFLNEFFTKTERTMFAKRLAIIAFLVKDVPLHRIHQVIKVSPSTTARLQLNRERGKYDHVINVLKNISGLKNFWEKLDNVLRVGGIMPSIVGKKSLGQRLEEMERPD